MTKIDYHHVMRRVVASLIRAATVFVIVFPFVNLQASEKPDKSNGPDLKILMRDTLVTLYAQNVPLRDVLEEIGIKCGLTIKLKKGLEKPISLSFTDLPIEVALRRLLQRDASVISYALDESGVIWRLKSIVAWGVGTGGIGVALIEHTLFKNDSDLKGIDGAARALNNTRIQAYLSDLNQEDRERVRYVLATLPDDPPFETLVSLMQENNDAIIRRVAVIGLRSFREERAKEALIAALSDGDQQVRLNAIQGLSSLRSTDSLEELSATLLVDPDAVVRREAAIHLARVRGVEAMAILAEALSDSDSMVRDVVVDTLARREAETRIQ